jgi:hypothetical protein
MKNLETKTKRMSLANIEGKLSVTEMEEIMAGSGGRNCYLIGAGMFFSLAMGNALGVGGFIGGYFTGASMGCF